MAASPPAVELTRTSPSPAADPLTSSTSLNSREPSINSARRSRILSPSDAASKRLSTASNPSREAPKPNHQSSASSPPLAASTSPKPSTPASLRNKIPSFPPPQQSRISMVSVASNRDSWHPQFTSSLSYASVRDFAYPAIHPLHYGPTMSSGLTTPGDLQEAIGFGGWFTSGGSGYRRLSDPAVPSQDNPLWGDAAALFRQKQSNQPPPLNFEDGPPWSEDDDLQSPVVVPKQATHHRKHKSSMAHLGSQHNRHHSKNVFTPTTLQHFPRGDWESRRRSTGGHGLLEVPGDSYYTTSAGRQDLANGEPGGELYHHAETDEYDPAGAGYYDPDYVYSDDDDEEGGSFDGDNTDFYNSRLSKDYQFTIASPAEEMHGKAVALFDFIQENENELPLVEGQVVWVSYRHGMGWLVAEDPKTGESGLVPEEYVCLLRDMHAGATADALAPESSTDAHVSTFSTSSQDILPYTGVDKIRREQDRAIEEAEGNSGAAEGAEGVVDESRWCEGEEYGTPRLRSDAFEVEVRVNGRDEK